MLRRLALQPNARFCACGKHKTYFVLTFEARSVNNIHLRQIAEVFVELIAWVYLKCDGKPIRKRKY